MPLATGVTPEYGGDYPNARLAGDAEFDWPHAPDGDGGTVDIRENPPNDATIHDLSFAIDLADGWAALTNPELDLGFALLSAGDVRVSVVLAAVRRIPRVAVV